MKKKNLLQLIRLVPSYLRSIDHILVIKLFTFLFIMIFTNHNFAMEEKQNAAREIAEEDDYFSSEEYEYYMDLIQQVNPDAYAKLKQCESESSEICIKKFALDEGIMKVVNNELTQGYPFLLIDPSLKNFPLELQKKFSAIPLEQYNEEQIIPNITNFERYSVMQMIESIAPLLYQEIVAVDPTGLEHIQRYYISDTSFAVTRSDIDGLPVVLVGTRAVELPHNEQRFAIAHELGHYALGHLDEEPKIEHAGLGKKQKDFKLDFQKGKKVSGQLPFTKTLKKTWNRGKEDEADRFAVVDLGIDVADGIALGKRHLEKESGPKETFRSTHPLWSARIRHLKELGREVELRQSRRRPLEQIDWKKLAEDYLMP